MKYKLEVRMVDEKWICDSYHKLGTYNDLDEVWKKIYGDIKTRIGTDTVFLMKPYENMFSQTVVNVMTENMPSPIYYISEVQDDE